MPNSQKTPEVHTPGPSCVIPPRMLSFALTMLIILFCASMEFFLRLWAALCSPTRAKRAKCMHGILLHTLNAIFAAQFLALLFGKLAPSALALALATDFCACSGLANFLQPVPLLARTAAFAIFIIPRKVAATFVLCVAVSPRVQGLWAFCNVIWPLFSAGSCQKAVNFNRFKWFLVYIWGFPFFL